MSFLHHKTNLIDWFCFEDTISGMERDSSVLVLGEKEYCAPYLELLEKRVRNVSRRLDDGSYDYILIPVLCERVLRNFQGKADVMMKTLAETWLKQGGKILLGIENLMEFDRMTTGIRKPGVLYYRYSELTAFRKYMKQAFPDSKEWLYYPYPELEMPMSLYTDSFGPSASDVDEKTGYLIKEGQFPLFAPAYFYIFQPDGTHRTKLRDFHKFTPLYIKYNSSRKPEYAIKTEILRDDQGRFHAVKEGITPEANAHIETLYQNAEIIAEANPALKGLKAENFKISYGSPDVLANVQYPFMTGQKLSDIIAAQIRPGGAIPVEEIKETLDMVIGAKEGTVNPANIDCLFDNIIMEDGVPTVLDCEWVLHKDVEVRFLQYRILMYWYLGYRERLACEDLYSFLRNFGFDKEEMDRMQEMEDAFQKDIHGDGADSNVNAWQDRKLTVAHFEDLEKQLKDAREYITELKSQVKERDVTIRKEREINRLTAVHVTNLTNVIKVHERDIANLQKDMAYYQAHQSIPAKLKAGINQRYTAHFPVGSRRRKVLHYLGQTVKHPVKMLPMYLTESGRNRIHGDFAIGDTYLQNGKVSFPKAETPLVSIVIPCYNQVHYTYQCLQSILAHTDFEKTPYEVIIADDVSTDATRELGLYADNLVIARNKENMGFLKNCNQAAAIARGQFIFFLNNDTKVTDGWLESLVDLMNRDDSIGMVGSKLIYPDGRLQEAGGIIWSDGSGWNYGRLQDPADPEYNYVKEVDYISGAAIMIRTELWREIGGFDETFAPAYYEDTDLAFEVRKHGKKVVFQPKSVVIHFEGISNGTDTSDTSGLKHYQVVNQEKFREKWKEELKHQSENNGNPNPFKARERGQNSRYVLVVDHYVPTWDKDAGSKLDYQYMQLFLKKGYRVKFLGDNFAHEEPYTSELEQLGIEVLYGPKMQAGIWDWIDKNRNFINVAYLNRPHIAARYIDYIRENTKMKILYFGHDLHSLRLMREYEINGDESVREEAEYWHNVEYGVMRKADASYYPSEVEADIVHREDPSINCKGITAYVYDEPAILDENYEKHQGLLFVGGFGHPPNKDGLLWFVNEILPSIRERIPDIVLNVAGSKADEEVLALNERPDVNVLGFVSSERLDELYRENRLVVVPLRYGAGVKGKVVEALHAGAAVITTSCGAEGIPDATSALVIEDDPKDFADRVVALYNDIISVRNMSHNAVDFINRNYSPDGAWAKIQKDFDTDIIR